MSHGGQLVATLLTRSRSLKVNFAWAFVGNLIYAASQWGMLIAIAKLGTPEMVGQFSLGLAVTAPVVMFSNLGLRAVLTTDATGEYGFGDYLGLRLISTAIALGIIIGVTVAGDYGSESSWVILAVGTCKAIEAVSDVFYGLLQQHERMDRIAKSNIIKGLFSLLALAVAVYLTRTVVWGVAAMGVVWLAILLGYDLRNGVITLAESAALDRRLSRSKAWGLLRPRWHRQSMTDLIKLTLPLGISMMFTSLNTNVPRYFIEHYWGERELGFFAAGAYVITAGNRVVMALGQAASPRLARHYAGEEKAAFRELLLKTVGVGALLGVGTLLAAVLAGQQILNVLYRPEYSDYADVLVWLTAAGSVNFVAAFLGYGMTAAHRYRIQPIIFASSTLLAVILCLVLVPAYGLLGAAWTLLITTAWRAVAAGMVNLRAIADLGSKP